MVIYSSIILRGRFENVLYELLREELKKGISIGYNIKKQMKDDDRL